MSIEPSICTKKDIKILVRRIKKSVTGVFDYSDKSGLHHAVMAAIGDNASLLVSDFVSVAIKQVIDEDAKLDLSGQIDFVGYGDKVIKLPEQKAVRVRDARIDHVRHQREQLIKNHMRQMQAFITHHDGYVMPILGAMEMNNFETAGQAIEYLANT